LGQRTAARPAASSRTSVFVVLARPELLRCDLARVRVTIMTEV